MPAGTGEADNLAVTDVRLASKVAVINQPVKFSATVRNFGQRPASGVLNLFVDGTEAGVESQAIDLLGAGGTHAADFQHTFREAGPHEVDVRFTTDALEVDNRRALSTLVEKRLGVLIVDGSPNPDPGEEASFFVRTALELGGSQSRPPVFQVKTVNDVTVRPREPRRVGPPRARERRARSRSGAPRRSRSSWRAAADCWSSSDRGRRPSA